MVANVKASESRAVSELETNDRAPVESSRGANREVEIDDAKGSSI